MPGYEGHSNGSSGGDADESHWHACRYWTCLDIAIDGRCGFCGKVKGLDGLLKPFGTCVRVWGIL